MTEREAYVAFNLTENIGGVGVARLVAQFGDAVSAWEAYPKKTSRSGGPVDWKAEMAKAEAIGVTLLTPADSGYPPHLRAASGHPLCLYVKGNAEVLSRPSLAMVGTRRATPYGLDQAFRFGKELAANGWVVVSGLALGVDAESHKGALAAEKGLTVGVIGSGLNCFYPEQNLPLAREIVKRGGAVVSEFPFGRAPDQQTFPQRNHVVAGLVRGVIVVEAPFKSGTMITAGIAADLGRTVMAIPGRVDAPMSAGCLQLIHDGALMVRSPGDVEKEMGDLFTGTKGGGARSARGDAPGAKDDAAALSREEALFLREVDNAGVDLDSLVRRTGLSAARVNALAMSLLMKGRVRFLPGNRLALPRE